MHYVMMVLEDFSGIKVPWGWGSNIGDKSEFISKRTNLCDTLFVGKARVSCKNDVKDFGEVRDCELACIFKSEVG